MRRWLAVLAVALLSGPALAQDSERIEAIGAVPIESGSTSIAASRDAAVQQALLEAVRKSAGALLQVGDEATLARLQQSLGDDPNGFVTRFQIVEDRGVRAAVFHAGPAVENEYVVVVVANVDRRRVRERLAAAGILEAPSGTSGGTRTLIELQEIDDYRVYAQIRDALVDAVGVRSATPVEASAGRMLIEVDSDRDADGLLAALRQSVPPRWMLVPLRIERDSLVLRVDVAGAATASGGPGSAGAAAVGPREPSLD